MLYGSCSMEGRGKEKYWGGGEQVARKTREIQDSGLQICSKV